MDRGLYIAASGMLAEQLRQEQIANDLANASTPGYKSDRTSQRSFGELLLANTTTGAAVGGSGLAVQVSAIETDFTAQPVRVTGQPLDFAIEGDGFFAVQTERGMRYTRNGQFTVSPQGTLVTALGDQVLDRNGRAIRVGADGRVDRNLLGVVLLANPRKEGDSLVTGTPGGQGIAGQVRSEALEGSGADAARAMVDMIASLRSFEAGQRAITTIDSTLEKAANRVGSVSGG
jgi:flagellar basal-body rod protein FlgG